MTHDELLNKITYERKFDEGLSNNALRAVVELHKPNRYPFQPGIVLCNECNGDTESVAYPCPTIQQIIENLK